ncbi:hypothetical protein POM88_029203 [Heracleum sosnowskyi]|uniref:Uncharacterized protein n=1 Tax=Heracleum sosnowskyi TaxID=360622 RepID=A0AAD8HTG1_9APIA|nr:hypothetical protein POM88_029203 [Heracleum sosnowskyi]
MFPSSNFILNKLSCCGQAFLQVQALPLLKPLVLSYLNNRPGPYKLQPAGPVDLNKYCPDELKVSNGDACKSACEAFGKPEYCCSGAHNTPETCKPSAYAAIFKMACPRAYSYAYDDLTSTFTCTGADYTITFCTSIPTSHTAVVNATPSTTNGNEQQAAMSSAPSPGTSGSGSGPEPEPMMRTSGSSDSRRNHSLSTLQFLFIASAFIFFF